MNSDRSTTCAVTVTYGNRGALVVRVLQAAIQNGVNQLVVIDNGSTSESIDLIRAYADVCSVKISLVSLGSNKGSAGGFKQGLHEAYRSEAKFIWLLDDDNLPNPDALSSLETAYTLLGNSASNVLCSYRADRLPYFRAVNYGEIPDVSPNSFLDFDFFQKIGKLICRKKKVLLESDFIVYPLVLTKLAPYGGLYMHRDWIEKVGLPDERMYLYGDDHEYTARIQKAGGRVYLCASSRIVDIDPSWSEVSIGVPAWMSTKSEDRKIFFAVRNRVFFEQRFVSSYPLYFFNTFAYMAWLFFISVVKGRRIIFTCKRLKLILNAVRWGWVSHKQGCVLGHYGSD